MGAGKILSILGGIIALVATLFFSFYTFDLMGFTNPGYGIALFMNFMDILDSGEILHIVILIVYAIGVVSGVFILIGAKVRALAIIGAIFALFLGVMLLLVIGLEIDLGADLNSSVNIFGGKEALVDGIIPFDLELGLGSPPLFLNLGTILLIGGGALGLIGGIIGGDDF